MTSAPTRRRWRRRQRRFNHFHRDTGCEMSLAKKINHNLAKFFDVRRPTLLLPHLLGKLYLLQPEIVLRIQCDQIWKHFASQ